MLTCDNGQLHAVQWMQALSGLAWDRLSAEHRNRMFSYGCLSRSVALVKKLYRQGYVDIHMNGDRAIQFSCEVRPQWPTPPVRTLTGWLLNLDPNWDRWPTGPIRQLQDCSWTPTRLAWVIVVVTQHHRHGA
jgi:hypothetical protein